MGESLQLGWIKPGVEWCLEWSRVSCCYTAKLLAAQEL